MALENSQAVHPVLRENIETLRQRREKQDSELSLQERFAIFVANGAGSLPFVYAHLCALIFWLLANSSLLVPVKAWDPNFSGLGTIASVEALFLTLFILINQNRMTAIASKNADLDLHVSLLAEHEITRLMTVCSAMAEKLDVETDIDDQVDDLKEDVPAEAVLDEIDEADKSDH